MNAKVFAAALCTAAATVALLAGVLYYQDTARETRKHSVLARIEISGRPVQEFLIDTRQSDVEIRQLLAAAVAPAFPQPLGSALPTKLVKDDVPKPSPETATALDSSVPSKEICRISFKVSYGDTQELADKADPGKTVKLTSTTSSSINCRLAFAAKARFPYRLEGTSDGGKSWAPEAEMLDMGHLEEPLLNRMLQTVCNLGEMRQASLAR